MADAAVKEPSMEDILSSIRQIIAEEGHSTESAEKVSEEFSSVRQSEEAHRNFGEQVFIQESSQVEEFHSVPVERVEMEHATKAPEPPLAEVPISDAYQGENRRLHSPISQETNAQTSIEQAPAGIEEVSTFKGALMSPSADSAVSSAFERLKRSSQDDLDAKTEALLRPMLREWLDENLPSMVERLIREEIERVARGV